MAIGGYRFLDPVKPTRIHALRIGGSLAQIRWHKGDEMPNFAQSIEREATLRTFWHILHIQWRGLHSGAWR
jgi:hypothetical protein